MSMQHPYFILFWFLPVKWRPSSFCMRATLCICFKPLSLCLNLFPRLFLSFFCIVDHQSVKSLHRNFPISADSRSFLRTSPNLLISFLRKRNKISCWSSLIFYLNRKGMIVLMFHAETLCLLLDRIFIISESNLNVTIARIRSRYGKILCLRGSTCRMVNS